MKVSSRIKLRLAEMLAPPLITLITRSLRLSFEGHDRYLAIRREGKGCIVAFWHESFFILPEIHRGENVHVLVSRHADGEIIHRVLARFGNATVRGSSSEGGREALAQLVGRAEDGFCLAITPDGPRGPRRELKPGVVALAQKTGLPIVLMANASERTWVLRSWDRFRVPKPFSRVRVVYSEPIPIDRDLSGEEFESARRMVEERLNQLCDRVESR